MKKTLSALLISGILLGTGVSTFAAAGDKLAAPVSGKTTLEIKDYTMDPATGLPTDPGSITLDEVPDIDFGIHSLNDVIRKPADIMGTFSKDLKVTDTRSTQTSIDAAKAEILAAVAKTDGTAPTQANIDASKKAWDAAVPVSTFNITAKADNMTGVASSIKLKDQDVLAAAVNVVTETSAKAVGTKTYTDNLKDAKLTVNPNGLTVGQYEGAIVYTLVNAQ